MRKIVALVIAASLVFLSALLPARAAAQMSNIHKGCVIMSAGIVTGDMNESICFQIREAILSKSEDTFEQMANRGQPW